jgi:hypothetical protein
MKNYFKLFFLVFSLSMLAVSCNFTSPNPPSYRGEDNDTNTNTNREPSAEYYVKYTIKGKGIYGRFSDIVYADVNGTKTASEGYQISSWSVTIGPVSKGFKAYVSNKGGGGDNVIEVSKNGGPFAQKATGWNSASYKIDF